MESLNLDNLYRCPIYSAIYESHGLEYLERAGYFENQDGRPSCLSEEEIHESMKIVSTPLLPANEYDDKTCILFTTGAMNPVHEDHFTMCLEAVKYLRGKGFNKVHIYVSPDPDEYCASKGQHHTFHDRIKRLNDLEVVMVDDFQQWAGRPINFTSVYLRLRLYINIYVGKDVPIYYVCGGDRAEFSLAFGEKAIVVERNGIDTHNLIHPLSVYIKPQDPLNYSSTEVREKEGISELKKKDLIIRKDTGSDFPFGIFEKYFSNIHIQDLKTDVDYKTISLDSQTLGEYNLAVSREFLFGGTKKLGHTSRPFFPSLEEQLESIPKGDYWLFDDDSFTGETVEYVTQFLIENGYRVLGLKTLVFSNQRDYEILDARDFRFGSSSGLCIRFPDGELHRLPYLEPFVKLYERASITEPLDFSIEIWNYLKNLSTYELLRIKQCQFTQVFIKLGFHPDTKFSEICEYYENVCRNAKGT